MGNQTFVCDGNFFSTVLSEDRLYLYKLVRMLGPSLFGRERPCAFVMLNPSTADEESDDPTVRRCMGYATAWGASALIIVNLFAFRSTEPLTLWDLPDPEGPKNHKHVCQVANYIAHTGGWLVCAWGAGVGFCGQDRRVLGWIRQEGAKPLALRVTQEGFPAHPLYLPAGLDPKPYAGRTEEEEATDHAL
ncbi:MAG TPA: DUF1643 domain-containing protein [Kiloniellaceae bacterium]|nr:DUF1643 domain-containing protein [Kiloniellaceae bacterium]